MMSLRRAVAVSMLFVAMSLQGCFYFTKDLHDLIRHAAAVTSECKTKVEEMLLPAKEEALPRLAGLCGESADCMDKGAQLVEDVSKIYMANGTMECMTYTVNATGGKGNETDLLPHIEEWSIANGQPMNVTFKYLLDKAVEYAQDESMTITDAEDELKKYIGVDIGEWKKWEAQTGGLIKEYDAMKGQKISSAPVSRTAAMGVAAGSLLMLTAGVVGITRWARNSRSRHEMQSEALVNTMTDEEKSSPVLE